MVSKRQHLLLPEFLVILGVVLLSIGLYGYSQGGSTTIACSPPPSIGDFQITRLTFQHIAYTDGCNAMWSPTYAALWPIGLTSIIVGSGFKAIQFVSRGNSAWGISIVLIDLGLLVGGYSLVLHSLVEHAVAIFFIIIGIVTGVTRRANS